ncbi:MAG: hypothetical protein CVU12_02110 [Bacteroidetes bacterium HGW-Bacteroidetes-7]|jgi:hypothetical protein|nr:MAG: hypothetical protein CVU12_02110 [Bacteroidetes bacterium HGW-Bacteroidetes-7]
MKYYIQRNDIYSVDEALTEGYDLSKTGCLEDFRAGKIIELNEAQIAFYNAYPGASTIEIFNCSLREQPELTLEAIKAEKIAQLKIYDSSHEVNSFMINGVRMWLDRNMRVSLMQTATILEASGETFITLWSEGPQRVSFEVQIPALKQFLAALEIYAKKCYDTTARHEADIWALETAEEVFEYDFKKYYPVKLNMQI